MTQVSRRYQVALLVIALFAAIWFVALRGHSHSSTGSGSGSSSRAAPAKSSEGGPGAPTGVYHGSAPGVEGLTRAISKAHEAVAQSERNAKRLGRKSEEASRSTAPAPGTSGSSGAASTSAGRSASAAASAASGVASHSSAHSRAAQQSHTPSSKASPSSTPKHQQLVERAIKEGKLVVLLFWSPRGGDDRAVHSQLRLLERAHREARSAGHSAALRRLLKLSGLELQKPITVLEARPNELTWFGTFTRAVQIYETPTILIVNRAGKVKTLTGLADAYSIEQAIDEARNS